MSDPSPTIRIVVVDDHEVVRSGIATWLQSEPDMDVVGVGAAGGEAIALVERHAPDVLLIDLHLRDTTATDVVRELRARGITTCIIVVTGYDKGRVKHVLQAGADGYLSKEERRETMLEAVRWGASRSGGVWVSPSALQGYLQAERELREADLTKAELQVLSVIDLPNDEICRRLAIGDGTLRNHLSNIYFKLRVSNRSGAIDKARLFGLV